MSLRVFEFRIFHVETSGKSFKEFDLKPLSFEIKPYIAPFYFIFLLRYNGESGAGYTYLHFVSTSTTQISVGKIFKV